MNLTIINSFMQHIDTSIMTGFGLIQGNVHFLFNSFLVITIVFFGLYAAFTDNDVIVSLFFKVLYIGFFSYIVTNWKPLSETIANSFATLGLTAGGSQITLAQFMDPGAIAYRGWNLTLSLLQYATDLSSGWGFAENLGEIALYLLTALGILVCFFIMAVQVFMAIITFKLVTLAAFILVPFGLWKGTGFMAERAIGYVFSSGIRLMILALVISLGQNLFSAITLNPAPTADEAAGALLGSLVFAVLCFYAPSMASDLVTGGPSLGAGGAFATAATAALGMGAAARSMSSAANSLVRTVQRMSSQSKVDQIARAAGAGMGGGGIHGGFRPTPPDTDGGGSGGSAAPRRKLTAESVARHLSPNAKPLPPAPPPPGRAQTLTAQGGLGSPQPGAAGSGTSAGQPDATERGAGKTPQKATPSTTTGKSQAQGGLGGRSMLAELRATRDGDGGGGMQPSIKDPNEDM